MKKHFVVSDSDNNTYEIYNIYYNFIPYIYKSEIIKYFDLNYSFSQNLYGIRLRTIYK